MVEMYKRHQGWWKYVEWRHDEERVSSYGDALEALLLGRQVTDLTRTDYLPMSFALVNNHREPPRVHSRAAKERRFSAFGPL